MCLCVRVCGGGSVSNVQIDIANERVCQIKNHLMSIHVDYVNVLCTFVGIFVITTCNP